MDVIFDVILQCTIMTIIVTIRLCWRKLNYYYNVTKLFPFIKVRVLKRKLTYHSFIYYLKVPKFVCVTATH